VKTEKKMGTETVITKASKQYAAAHEAHYKTKNLHEALELYKDITAVHPNTPEADYSLSQIQNIVKSVVPKQELLAAHLDLALAHLEPEVPLD
jgi:hypothetical protein